MPAHLVPVHSNSIPTVVISRPVILIGRHPECDVRIDSLQVSRRHCCVAMAYDRLVIRDLGSRNGIRVNGRSIEEVILQPGDEVAIAQFLYRLEMVQPESATRRQPPTPAPLAAPSAPAIIDLDDDFIPLDD